MKQLSCFLFQIASKLLRNFALYLKATRCVNNTATKQDTFFRPHLRINMVFNEAPYPNAASKQKLFLYEKLRHKYKGILKKYFTYFTPQSTEHLPIINQHLSSIDDFAFNRANVCKSNITYDRIINLGLAIILLQSDIKLLCDHLARSTRKVILEIPKVKDGYYEKESAFRFTKNKHLRAYP